jgi:hypothetical protein
MRSKNPANASGRAIAHEIVDGLRGVWNDRLPYRSAGRRKRAPRRDGRAGRYQRKVTPFSLLVLESRRPKPDHQEVRFRPDKNPRKSGASTPLPSVVDRSLGLSLDVNQLPGSPHFVGDRNALSYCGGEQPVVMRVPRVARYAGSQRIIARRECLLPRVLGATVARGGADDEETSDERRREQDRAHRRGFHQPAAP